MFSLDGLDATAPRDKAERILARVPPVIQRAVKGRYRDKRCDIRYVSYCMHTDHGWHRNDVSDPGAVPVELAETAKDKGFCNPVPIVLARRNNIFLGMRFADKHEL
jgi:hypothetical protein